MPDTAVKMTLAELCRAVAEEMGNTVGLIYHRGETYTWLNTGNGMLSVLQWLREDRGRWNDGDFYLTLAKRHRAAPGWLFLHIQPVDVLLAFMKAVKGVEVELVNGHQE